MAEQVKYLVTVDAATGAAVKIERLGPAGELTEVPISALSVATSQASPNPGAGLPVQPSRPYAYADAPPVPVTQPHVPIQLPPSYAYSRGTPPRTHNPDGTHATALGLRVPGSGAACKPAGDRESGGGDRPCRGNGGAQSGGVSGRSSGGGKFGEGDGFPGDHVKLPSLRLVSQ